MASVNKVTALLTGAAGLPGYQNLYFSSAGSVMTSAEATDVCGRVRAFWDSLKAYLAVGVQVDVDGTVEAYDAASGNLLGVQAVSAPASVVSTGTALLPPATQGGLRFKSGTVVSNRILQGRTFVGPLTTNAATSGGKPTSALITQLATAGGLLATGGTASVHLVWHRPGPAHSGGQSAGVISYIAATDFWVLRSRRD